MEISGVFTFVLSPQCGGNTRDLCYIGKKEVQWKHNRLRWETAVVLPADRPRSVGVIAGV